MQSIDFSLLPRRQVTRKHRFIDFNFKRVRSFLGLPILSYFTKSKYKYRQFPLPTFVVLGFSRYLLPDFFPSSGPFCPSLRQEISARDEHAWLKVKSYFYQREFEESSSEWKKISFFFFWREEKKSEYFFQSCSGDWRKMG